MKNFIIVAEQDRGKSYFCKNEILKKFHNRKNYIFDINNEYGEFKNEARNFATKDLFLNNTPSKINSCLNVVFEEASAFFSKQGGTSRDTISHICRRYHTKNINVFMFHAIDQIPKDILYYIDFIVLFRTKDNLENVQKIFKDYPQYIEAFKRVKQKTENTFFDRFKKTYLNEHSKKYFHYHEIITK